MFRERVDRGLQLLVGQGLGKGLLGGSNVWLAVGASAAAARFLRKGRKPRKLVEQLAPGEKLEIVHLLPGQGRRR